jgi:hypothetical protein
LFIRAAKVTKIRVTSGKMGILYCSNLLNKVNADFMGSKHKKTVVNINGLNREKSI